MGISGIYWTDFGSGQLKMIDPDLDVVSIVASGMILPKGIYANDTDEKFYIAANDRVYRCNYDGSNLETIIVSTDLPPPNTSLSLQDIVVDSSGAKLYFNDSYYGRVYRTNLDGSSLEVVYSAPVDPAWGGYRGMVIDPVNQYVYWAVTRPAGHPGAEVRAIERIDYDGSNFTTIIQRNSLDFPFVGLALDVSRQIMYWTNPSEGFIESSGLGGGSSSVIINSNDPYFVDIDFERQKVYWYDNTDDILYYDGITSGFQVTVTSGLDAGGILFASNNYPTQPSQTMNLFIKTDAEQSQRQGTSIRTIHHLTKTADYNPQLIGSLELGVLSVNIRVWDIVDGVNILDDITNSVCYQIGDTGKWGWSTEHLSFASGIKNYHYYYEMTTNTNDKDYGEFFLIVPERGRWAYFD